jgi:hypothetical protein
MRPESICSFVVLMKRNKATVRRKTVKGHSNVGYLHRNRY